LRFSSFEMPIFFILALAFAVTTMFSQSSFLGSAAPGNYLYLVAPFCGLAWRFGAAVRFAPIRRAHIGMYLEGKIRCGRV